MLLLLINIRFSIVDPFTYGNMHVKYVFSSSLGNSIIAHIKIIQFFLETHENESIYWVVCQGFFDFSYFLIENLTKTWPPYTIIFFFRANGCNNTEYINGMAFLLLLILLFVHNNNNNHVPYNNFLHQKCVRNTYTPSHT